MWTLRVLAAMPAMLIVLLSANLPARIPSALPAWAGCSGYGNGQYNRWESRAINYKGSMLGVHARIALFSRKERAFIQLKGLPVGSGISGVAHFKSDGCTVELDADMERALARRRVQIVSAGVRHDYSKIWVVLKLPLGFGQRIMLLDRITN